MDEMALGHEPIVALRDRRHRGVGLMFAEVDAEVPSGPQPLQS